jgi:hypothetical protein
MCAVTGYAAHIPGLKSNNIVGHAFRTSRRLSRAESIPHQEHRGVRPGVAGYAGFIRGRQGFQTCGISYDREVAYLSTTSENPETAHRDMANWKRESDLMNASRLFESRPLKVDANNLLTTEECEAVKKVPVVRAPMRIPGQRSMQDDRLWSYQVKGCLNTDRFAGVPSYSMLAEPLRYSRIYPGFRAGGYYSC